MQPVLNQSFIQRRYEHPYIHSRTSLLFHFYQTLYKFNAPIVTEMDKKRLEHRGFIYTKYPPEIKNSVFAYERAAKNGIFKMFRQIIPSYIYI